MFTYNRFSTSGEEQQCLLNCQVVIAGAGLGGVIAECILKIGFSCFHLIDGSLVELSDLNRHNYSASDIGQPKVEALARRLISINPNVQVKTTFAYPDADNIHELLSGASIAIDTLDFSSDLPFAFDRGCVEIGIPVLHPCNLGWNACVFMIFDENTLLEYLIDPFSENVEMRVVDLVIDILRPQLVFDTGFLEGHRTRCVSELNQLPLPQLVVGAYQAASLCGEILFNFAQGRDQRCYYGFYHSFYRKEFYRPVF